jgi:hypothetical protein
MSPLRWTCEGTRRLAKELTAMGHKISRTVVGELLSAQKFSLQGNRKTLEGGQSPDRDAQFLHINDRVTKALALEQPVISVDPKKKELVGDFKNNGREWRPRGSPEAVRVHDFVIPELGRAVPYGVYDIAANAGWVSVGMSADTAEFAVGTIRRWWHEIGHARYPDTKYLTITADADTMTADARRTSDAWRDGQELDLHEEMMKLTLRIVAKTLFDADMGDDVDVIGRAMDISVGMFVRAMSKASGSTKTPSS